MFSEAFTPAAAISSLSGSIGAQAASEIDVVSSRDQVVEVASLSPESQARVALSFSGENEGDGPTAVVTPLDPEQLRGARQLAAVSAAGAVSIEKEQVYSVLEEVPQPPVGVLAPYDADGSFEPSLFPAGPDGDFIYGIRIPQEYFSVVRGLREKVAGGMTAPAEVAPVAVAAYVETASTWGLQATGAANSPFDGRGIKLAVLDTGFNFQHPDFQGGIAPTAFRSFIAGETASDAHGHGTHVAGTAAGPRTRSSGPGYGVANSVQLHIGKVLGNSGTGSSAQILEGMRWAIQEGCQVINMSLARRVGLDETTHSAAYETVAQHALQQNCLIVAAAGNFSSRPALTWPVCEPANSPSIMAVGAIDEFDRTASFSCGGTSATLAAARVDIAGPGVRVYSSYKQPELYSTLNGTSMASPHVAGIAALYAQVKPDWRGVELWTQVVRTVRPLALPPQDVGFGLVRAP
jgi:subtilisin family serine protease